MYPADVGRLLVTLETRRTARGSRKECLAIFCGAWGGGPCPNRREGARVRVSLNAEITRSKQYLDV